MIDRLADARDLVGQLLASRRRESGANEMFVLEAPRGPLGTATACRLESPDAVDHARRGSAVAVAPWHGTRGSEFNYGLMVVISDFRLAVDR